MMKNNEKDTAKKPAKPEKIRETKAADAEALTDEALEKVAGGDEARHVRHVVRPPVKPLS